MRLVIPRWFSWGIADQAMSSATNFGLTLVAGRVLGPRGLGVVFLGFAIYLLCLALHRALIFDPLVVASASLPPDMKRERTAHGLTLTLIGSVTATAVMLVVGMSVDGPLARGTLLFAPWIVPAMLQDLWRVVLFRDDRGGKAAFNDLVWIVGMGASLPFAVGAGSDLAVVSCWGAGSLLAALVGFFQTRVRLRQGMAALKWWAAEAWPWGRWLATASIVSIASFQLVVFLLAGILGAAAIGGFRAVQTLFAPMTLLGPAASLPGLPRVAVAVRQSATRARRLALRMSAAVATLALLYVLAVLLGGGALLEIVFGASFVGYEELIVPMSIGQLVLASALGFSLLLKASRRSDSLLVTRGIAAVGGLALAPLLASRFGLQGAVWGLVIASTLENATVIVFSNSIRFGSPRGDRTDGGLIGSRVVEPGPV